MADPGGFDYWRGGEQAPLPATGSDSGGFDYWRGGELLTVHSEAPAAPTDRLIFNVFKSMQRIPVMPRSRL